MGAWLRYPSGLNIHLIIAASSVLLFILTTIMFAFNAQGDTFTLTKLFAISTLINLILDPILIFGWLGFPAMGIAGAAIATVISQLVFIVLAIRSLMGKHRMIRFHFRNLTFRWESVKKVLDIGVPAALTQVIFPVGLAALTYITALGFFEPGTIAYSIGLRIEFFAFLPAVGFGFGAMAMMGQNIGAGNMDRAREAFKKALRYGFIGAATFGIITAITAGFIIRAFTNDPLVTNYAYSYIWTVALISYGFLAAMMVVASAFQAIGKSWPGFWIFFLKYAVISIPLAYILTQVSELPIISVWIAIILGNIIAAVVGYLWIRRTLNNLKAENHAVPAQDHE